MDFSVFDYAYALSGGIGSGKSSVCKILQSCGYEVIDADVVAHQVLQEKKDEVVLNFGKEVLEDGEISRKKLGQIVFADRKKLKILDQILTQRIQESIYQECLRLEEGKKKYFIEIALLFENRDIYNFRHNVLIACSIDTQIRRVSQRNSLKTQEVKQRIHAQLSLQEKIKMAQYILWNEGSEEELKSEVQKLLQIINATSR